MIKNSSDNGFNYYISIKMKNCSLNLVNIRIKMRTQQENIRRQKRHEIYKKKRPNLILEEAEWMQINCIDFTQVINMLNSPEVNVNVLRIIKRNLERGEKYIQTFMSSDQSVYKLKEFLAGSDVEKLLEAIGCCTNLCFSSHESTIKIINLVAPYLITFLHGSNPILQEYSSICIGNMAYDCQLCCTLLKQQGLMFTLIPLLQSSHQQVIKSCLFMLQNFSKYLDSDDIEKLIKEGILTIISKLLLHKSTDPDLYQDIYYVLFCLTAQIEFNKEYFYKESFHCIALNHLKYFCLEQCKNISIITAIVRFLGNLTSSDNIFSYEIINHKYFEDCLIKLLNSSFQHIKKEILWLLQNIFASCDKQLVKSNINITLLINALSTLLLKDETMNEKLSAGWPHDKALVYHPGTRFKSGSNTSSFSGGV